jgi:hypothetical protein
MILLLPSKVSNESKELFGDIGAGTYSIFPAMDAKQASAFPTRRMR